MSEKKVAAIVPARMASSRFPGKPLAGILGLPMIEHVRRRAALSDLVDDVYVATCDEEIREAVEAGGGRVIMTADTHQRGTDRVEEAASKLEADIVVNVQGDEPALLPDVIGAVVQPLIERDDVLCTNIVYPITEAELDDINAVKVVLDQSRHIMYFSRSPIPHFKANDNYPLYVQAGIIAFRKEFLHRYSRLTPTPLEKAESVDMLRVLEHGYKILAVVTPLAGVGVDLPEDIAKVEGLINGDKTQKEYYSKIVSL